MGRIADSLNLLKFYNTKTVMPSYKFKVYFDNQDFKKLQDYHVLSVSVPLYKFEPETTMYGAVPKSYSKLSHKGFAVKITYEDDHKGTVLQMIHEMQKSVISQDGLYVPLHLATLGNLNIEIINNEGDVIGWWQAKNTFYLGADDVTLDYSSNDTMKYSINIGADVIKFIKYDVSIFKQLARAASTRLSVPNPLPRIPGL